jgi:pimeloyl-ACP methyl ester carboxylesterase
MYLSGNALLVLILTIVINLAASDSGIAGDTGKIIERPGVAIEVFAEGQGPMVLMIPSLGRGAVDFIDLAKRLSTAGYTAVRIQPRGIGQSRGPLKEISLHDLAMDAATVIEALKGQPAFVIGHAFGNRVARMLAAKRPELVRAVVLLAAGGKAPMEPVIRDSLTKSFDLEMPEAERLEHVRRAFFAPGNDPSVWRGGWYPEVATAQGAATQATKLQDWWSGGKVPILVVQPLKDTVATPVNARMLKEEFGDRVTVVDIADAGHALLPEQPEAVARAVINYIRSH